jgi:hypothetical protein
MAASLEIRTSRSLGSAVRFRLHSLVPSGAVAAFVLAVTSPISSRITPTEKVMNLEQTLEKIVEHAREELRIVRKRAEEKTAARDHGKDYHEAQVAADRLDHYAHLVRRLHDAQYKDGWRHESLNEGSSR